MKIKYALLDKLNSLTNKEVDLFCTLPDTRMIMAASVVCIIVMYAKMRICVNRRSTIRYVPCRRKVSLHIAV